MSVIKLFVSRYLIRDMRANLLLTQSGSSFFFTGHQIEPGVCKFGLKLRGNLSRFEVVQLRLLGQIHGLIGVVRLKSFTWPAAGTNNIQVRKTCALCAVQVGP